MKTSKLKFAFIAFLALAAVCAIAGYPVVSPDILAGLGIMPMVIGNTDVTEILSLVQEQGRAAQEYRAKQIARIDALEESKQMMEDFMAKAGSPFTGGSTSSRPDNGETKQFLTFMRSGREADLQQKSMSAGSDPDGGYLLPTQLDNELNKYLRQLSPMRQLARVVQVGGGELKLPFAHTRAATAWTGETSARANTAAPALKMLTIPTCEIFASPAITQTLLDDNVFDLQNWLVEELAQAFGDAEGAAFINGDGVAKPRGLFTYDVLADTDATRSHDKFQFVPTGVAGGFAPSSPADALIRLAYSLFPAYRANASWLMSPEVLEECRKFRSSTGEYLWEPSVAAGQPPTFLGYPIFEDVNIPAIASGSLSVAFGDFKRAYTITDRSTAMLRDPFTQKPYVVFYTTKRLGGGGGLDTRAVKFLKFAAS